MTLRPLISGLSNDRRNNKPDLRLTEAVKNAKDEEDEYDKPSFLSRHLKIGRKNDAKDEKRH
jgi:hypothetical protein